MKIKMHMDCWEELQEKLMDILNEKLKHNYDDDVLEFELEIKNIKNITDKVGVDEDGERAFEGVEINDTLYSAKGLSKEVKNG